MNNIKMDVNARSFLRAPSIVLTISGVWPITQNWSLLNTMYRITMMISQLCFLFCNGMYMITMWGDLKAVSDALYMLFTKLTTASKAVSFCVNFEKFKLIAFSMDEEVFTAKNEDEMKIIQGHCRTVTRMYKMVLSFTAFTISQWVVISALDSENILPYNEIWVPIDISKSPNYEITFIIELWVTVVSSAVYMSVDSITIATMMFSCAQLDIIMKKINDIREVPLSSSTLNERSNILRKNNEILTDCFKHHQAVVRFSELCEGSFYIHSLFQLSGTVFMICVIGFRMVGESPGSGEFCAALSYLIIILTQIYLYCWCANELTYKCEQVRVCLYLTPWYDQDKTFKVNLRIAMECMKKPITFRAGRYIPLSRPTFVSILRSSYSYFAFLSQATEQ